MYLTIILMLVNFVKTLFNLAIIYFGIKLFSRYVLPFLVQKGVKNMQQKMQDQFREQQGSTKPEGDVTIETKRNNQKTNSSDKGEYIDFEEVE